jgi:hypothetical protein
MGFLLFGNKDFQVLKRTLSVMGEKGHEGKSVYFGEMWVRNMRQRAANKATPASLRDERNIFAIVICRQKGQPSPIHSWSRIETARVPVKTTDRVMQTARARNSIFLLEHNSIRDILPLFQGRGKRLGIIL